MCQILDKYLKYTVSIILSKNKHTCMRFEVLKKKFVIDGYIPLFFPSCFKNQRKWNRTVIRVIHNLFLSKKKEKESIFFPYVMSYLLEFCLFSFPYINVTFSNGDFLNRQQTYVCQLTICLWVILFNILFNEPWNSD